MSLGTSGIPLDHYNNTPISVWEAHTDKRTLYSRSWQHFVSVSVWNWSQLFRCSPVSKRNWELSTSGWWLPEVMDWIPIQQSWKDCKGFWTILQISKFTHFSHSFTTGSTLLINAIKNSQPDKMTFLWRKSFFPT